MSEAIFNMIEERLRRAEEAIKRAKTLAQFLEKAGEDTAEIEMKIREAEEKLSAYKQALQEIRHS